MLTFAEKHVANPDSKQDGRLAKGSWGSALPEARLDTVTCLH